MTDNLKLWDALSKTDPRHTKSFKRAGGFSGTAIKPIWIIQRLTSQFGPVGEGWGMREPSFQVVPGNNGEVLVYCTVECWHTNPDNVLYGVGGDKVVTYIKANDQYKRPERWENDDEAFKKAFTDAVGNAFKFLGVGADVHMGQFDDSKYVQEVAQEFAQSERQGQSQSGAVSPARQPAHSALKTAVRSFVHHVNGCGDLGEFVAFTDSAESKALIADVKAKMPDWFTGWDEQPDGFTPLGELLAKRRTELEAAETDNQYGKAA